MISRIKDGFVSDPVMRGKMLNKTAKMAARGGLKWRALDPDEPQYKSVTKEQLEIIGQT